MLGLFAMHGCHMINPAFQLPSMSTLRAIMGLLDFFDFRFIHHFAMRYDVSGQLLQVFEVFGVHSVRCQKVYGKSATIQKAAWLLAVSVQLNAEYRNHVEIFGAVFSWS